MKKLSNLAALCLLSALIMAGPITALFSTSVLPAGAQDVAREPPTVNIDTSTTTEAVPVEVSATEVTEVVGEPTIIQPWWQSLWNDVKGPVYAILPIVLVWFLRRYVGEREAQIAQEMLASATMRGAGGVINQLGSAVATSVLTPNNPIVQAQVAEIKQKMADTIRKTGATDRTLAENIVNQVGQLIAAGGQLLDLDRDEHGRAKRI